MRWDPERALAAVVAASESRLNYAQIALMYGEGATTSAIEHRFRNIRQVADGMRTSVNDGTKAAPQPRTRTARSTLPGDTPQTPTPRSGRKRSPKKGSATKKSSKSTDNTRDAIPIDGSDEDDEGNSPAKRTKTDNASPTPRNQLPDINSGRTAFFDSRLNGYELAPTGTSTNAPEQDESVDFDDMVGGFAYGYFNEA